MDLNTISSIVPLRHRDDLCVWKPGSAWLAGGTWLFSEPQPALDTLLDLVDFEWPPLVLDEAGLHIAATCTLAQLYGFVPPPGAPALDLIPACCNALLGSFKIWNAATVGGNICLALPAAPMVALTVALEGVGLIWNAEGDESRMPMVDFVLGSQHTALAPGEILRAIEIPRSVFRRRAVHRKISLTPLGRSAALLVGTSDGTSFALTVTASTSRPVRLDFDGLPTTTMLRGEIEAKIPFPLYYDDMHGRPAWRRHLTYALAEEIRMELCDGPAP